MSNLIEGVDVLGQMEIDSVWYDIFCAKDLVLRYDGEEIETTTVNSTRSREYVPGMNSWLLSISGVTESDNSEGRVSLLYLLQEAMRTEIHSMRVFMTDRNGTTKAVTFSGFLRSGEFTGNAFGMSNCDAEFRITGSPSLGTPVDPPAPPDCELEDTIYLRESDGGITAGQYIANSALLQQTGVEIIAVIRSGPMYDYTTGTPSGMQFTHDLPNGDIIFDSNITFNSGEWVAILYKIVT